MSKRRSVVDFLVVGIAKDFLTTRNSLRIPAGNLGIPRSNMPQLDNFNAFKRILGDMDVRVYRARRRISDIKLAQGEVNKDKVFGLMVDYRIKNKNKRGGVDFGGNPPVITRDGFVFDGLHRQVAMYNYNRHAYHDYTVVDMDFTDLYKLVRNNPSLFQDVVSYKRL